MNTAKHSKDLNSQLSPKKTFPYWIKQRSTLMLPILLGTLLGTYLDLYFTGKGLYSFPIRPMSSVFSINIAFTLLGLPLLTGVFLFICNKINGWQKVGVILLISLLMSIAERQAEALGFFAHHESWIHMYSFFGYFIYLTWMDFFYRWLK
jgi:hypothetical protein